MTEYQTHGALAQSLEAEVTRLRAVNAELRRLIGDELHRANLLRKAAWQALEALITAAGYTNDKVFVKVLMARDALREALEAAPQPARQLLTDEELWKFWCERPEVPDGEDDSMEAEFVAAVRRILAAHGIGGEA